MARRKKKSATRRRPRVGAMALNPSSPLVQYGSIALGFFMGDKINEQLLKLTGGKLDAKLMAAGEAGLGAFLAFKKGKKTLITSVLGGALLGAGVKSGLKEFGIINGIGGYGAVPVVGNRIRLNGYGKVPVVGQGYTPNRSLNGYKVPGTMNRVMGSTGSGSGLMTNGSECMS